MSQSKDSATPQASSSTKQGRTTRNSQRAQEEPDNRAKENAKVYSINWLFFDPEHNPELSVYSVDVSGEQYGRTLQILRNILKGELEEEFGFRARYVKYYTPNSPISIYDIYCNKSFLGQELESFATPRPPAGSIQKLLGNPDELDSSNVHIIVTAVEEDSVGPVKEKRTVRKAVDRHTKLQNMRGQIGAPSAAAKSAQLSKFQGDTWTVIYNGFYPSGHWIPVAPPIEAFHPVFASFVRNATSTEDILLDAAFVKSVSKTMEQAAKIIPAEKKGNDELRSLLSAVFLRSFQPFQTSELRSADGNVTIEIGGSKLAILVMERKRMWGEGGCDPMKQAEYSALNLWAEDAMKPFVNMSCCPTLIVATAGAWLTVLGWVITADVEVVAQPLIDIMWLGEATPYEDTHVYNVARVFAALRKSLHDLEAYYRGLALEPTPNTQSPASFPHPTTFTAADGSEVQFRYLQRLEDDAASVTFLAETVKSGASENVSRIVVKFVDRYGADAHRLLARANLAPALLYFGALDGKTMTTEQDVVKFGLYVGPIRMVVMEFVDGSTVADDAKRPDNAKEKLTNALRVLHAEDYVFGDLRAPNVMFTKDGELRLIDFNWAGKDGVATYPRRLSTTIRWAAGVEEFGPMRKEHDLEMLERMFPL